MLVSLSACEFYYFEPRVDSRDRMIGRYDVEEYSETFNDYSYYTFTIERSSRYSNEIIIRNFYGVDINVRATVTYDKITIHRQIIDGYEIEGTGTLYGRDLMLTYRVRDLYTNVPTDFCSVEAWQF